MLTALPWKAAHPSRLGRTTLRLVHKAEKLNGQQILLVSSGFRTQAIHFGNPN